MKTNGVNDNPSNGKGKEKSISLRSVPLRIARQWDGENSLGEIVGRIGLDEVALCCSDTLSKVRRRLQSQDKDGGLWVRVGVDGPKTAGLDDGDVGGNSDDVGPSTDEDSRLQERDIWLECWDEVPDNHVMLVGPEETLPPDWTNIRCAQKAVMYV
jgi:hypothetical protein